MDVEKCLIHDDECGIYRFCCYHNDQCGPYKRSTKPIDGIYGIGDLTEDTKHHFRSMKLNDTKGLSELDLIENRGGRKLTASSKVCAYHRYTLGVGYKLKRRCQHPNHEELPKQKKGHCTRVASLKVCDAISDRYGTVFPVGGVLCTTHYKEGNKSVEEKDEEERIDVDEEIVVADEEERIDVDYVTEEIVVAEDKTLAAVNTSMNIATCFETSPVKTLKIKKVNDLCKRSKQNYKMKYHKLKEKLKQSFAEAAAPGQEKDFLK